MLYHETLNETLAALKDVVFDRAEAMPAHIRAGIRAQTTELNTFGELLQRIYDAPVGAGDAETIGPQLAQVAAAGLDVFSRSGFLAIGKPDDTGSRPSARMRLALLRDAGEAAPEGTAWPDPSADPERRPFPEESETEA